MDEIRERSNERSMKSLIWERTILKILVERTGILFSITMESRAFFFFISASYLGIKVAPTTDPYPGIVEVCGYSIPRIIQNWKKLANIKVTSHEPSKRRV